MKTRQIINYLIIAILVVVLGMLVFKIYKTFTKKNQNEEYASADFKELKDIVEKITGKAPTMCFPNYANVQDSREHESKFYKHINHMITDAVVASIKKGDFVNVARIYLLLPQMFKMESKQSYDFVAYGTDKKVIPREKYITSQIEYIEIIDPSGKKMTFGDILSFLGQMNKGPNNLDPYFVTDSIGPDGKAIKVAMNPTRPPLDPSAPKPKSNCKDGQYCCKNGICFQPTEEYTLFYKVAQNISKLIQTMVKQDSKLLQNTLIRPDIFGQIVPYLYVKRNAYLGVIKTIPSKQNDRIPVSPYVCCDDDPSCVMAAR
jgi:hypothetical protein